MPVRGGGKCWEANKHRIVVEAVLPGHEVCSVSLMLAPYRPSPATLPPGTNGLLKPWQKTVTSMSFQVSLLYRQYRIVDNRHGGRYGS